MESSLYILIPISVLLVFVIGWLFWWSVKSGQFDDMDGPAFKLMMDDDQAPLSDEQRRAEAEKNRTLV